MTLLQDLNHSYQCGEMDALKTSLIPFLKANKQQLCEFISQFVSRNGPQPIDNLIKYFILSFNMPFNMKSYMNTQSKAMEKDIGPEIRSNKRKDLINNWIREKAAVFREHSIMQQIYCFEMMKDETIAQISEELDLNQILSQSNQ